MSQIRIACIKNRENILGGPEKLKDKYFMEILMLVKELWFCWALSLEWGSYLSYLKPQTRQ